MIIHYVCEGLYNWSMRNKKRGKSRKAGKQRSRKTGKQRSRESRSRAAQKFEKQKCREKQKSAEAERQHEAEKQRTIKAEKQGKVEKQKAEKQRAGKQKSKNLLRGWSINAATTGGSDATWAKTRSWSAKWKSGRPKWSSPPQAGGPRGQPLRQPAWRGRPGAPWQAPLRLWAL